MPPRLPPGWLAMYWANWLLGNALDAPVVEVTLGGFTLVAEDDCTLALAGGDLDARVDDQPVQPWRSLRLGKGQRLSLRQPRQGARASRRRLVSPLQRRDHCAHSGPRGAPHAARPEQHGACIVTRG